MLQAQVAALQEEKEYLKQLLQLRQAAVEDPVQMTAGSAECKLPPNFDAPVSDDLSMPSPPLQSTSGGSFLFPSTTARSTSGGRSTSERPSSKTRQKACSMAAGLNGFAGKASSQQHLAAQTRREQLLKSKCAQLERQVLLLYQDQQVSPAKSAAVSCSKGVIAIDPTWLCSLEPQLVT